MPCMWCEDGGYWECGTRKLCQPTNIRDVDPIQWKHCGSVDIQEGQKYYVKCRPGCEAAVDEDASVTPPWVLDGDFVGGSEGPVGTYDLYCGTGHGHPCQVKLVPAR